MLWLSPRTLPFLLLFVLFLPACGSDFIPFEAILDEVTVNLPDIEIPDDTGGSDEPDTMDTFTDIVQLPVPSLTAIDPPLGSPNGGELVSLIGEELDRLEEIYFGDEPALEFYVTGPSVALVTTPAHDQGIVSVRAVFDDGTEVFLEDGFEFLSPIRVLSVSPTAGSILGGTPLEISGEEFSDDSFVIIGGKMAINPKVVSDTLILVTSPSNLPGIVDVTVSSNNASNTLESSFRYANEPAPVSIQPLAGPAEGGNLITISGTAFEDVEAIYLGGTAVEEIEPTAPELERFGLAPAGSPGPATLLLEGSFGVREFSGLYTYMPADDTFQLLNVSPDSGLPGTQVKLVVNGLKASPEPQVLFGETVAKFIEMEGYLVTVEVPQIDGGPQDITITQGEEEGELTGVFTVLSPMSVADISPKSGPREGGTAFTVEVEGCDGDSCEVFIGALPATSIEQNVPGQLSGITPPGSVGWVDVRVTNGAQSTVLPQGFQYESSEGLFAYAVVPAEGSMAGGTYVEILGSGFTEKTTVKLGEDEVVNTEFHSANRISFYTPPSILVQTVKVAIEEGTESRDIPGGFSYYNPTLELGGTWGGVIQNTVNISVLDGVSRLAIMDAAVILNAESLGWECQTDQNGHCTFSDPSLDGPVDASAFRSGYTASTIHDFNAKNATIYLFPQTPPTPGPPGPGVPAEPPFLSGKVTGLGKFVIPPTFTCADLGLNGDGFEEGHCTVCDTALDCPDNAETCLPTDFGPGYCTSTCMTESDCPSPLICAGFGGTSHCILPAPEKAAFCTTSYRDEFYPDTLAGNMMANPLDEDDRYMIMSYEGPTAVVCMGGFLLDAGPGEWQELEPQRFFPTVMGVLRNVFPIAGQVTDGLDIELNIPLSRTLSTSLSQYPLPPEAPEGVSSVDPSHTLTIQIEIELDGNDGIIAMPAMPLASVPEGLSPSYNGFIGQLTQLKEEAFGPNLEFPFFPEELVGPLAGATYQMKINGQVNVYNATSENTALSGYGNATTEVVIRNAPNLSGIPILFWDPEALAWNSQELSTDRAVLGATEAVQPMGVAVGEDGLIVHFDGEKWWPQSNIVSATLHSVATTPTGEVIAVGDEGSILRFNGTAWSQEESPLSGSLSDIFVDATGTPWVVGMEGILTDNDGVWEQVPAIHSTSLLTVTGTAEFPLVAAGVNGKVLAYDGSTWTPGVPHEDIDWLGSCADSTGEVTLVGSGGNVLTGIPGNWMHYRDDSGATLNSCHYDETDNLWTGGAQGTLLVRRDGAWEAISVNNLGTDLHTMTTINDTLWALGRATKVIGPFLDYPQWVYPVTADDTLGDELSWVQAAPVIPDFSQITFTPCQTYLPWYFIMEGTETSVFLADFDAYGLVPEEYPGYLLYLNHRRSTVPFDINHFVMSVDLQPERAEAASSISSMSSTCFF